tara:strand:- start:2576 stop:3082 length:507 start_codon:yes stop_codon:yes gene_type:complete
VKGSAEIHPDTRRAGTQRELVHAEGFPPSCEEGSDLGVLVGDRHLNAVDRFHVEESARRPIPKGLDARLLGLGSYLPLPLLTLHLLDEIDGVHTIGDADRTIRTDDVHAGSFVLFVLVGLLRFRVGSEGGLKDLDEGAAKSHGGSSPVTHTVTFEQGLHTPLPGYCAT